MGRKKRWSPQESTHLAAAWMTTSEDTGSATVKGTNQDMKAFWLSAQANFKKLAPAVASGAHHKRGMGPIKGHWSNGISRDCKKFNKCLVKVHSSKPTGVTEENKVNMAVAIHTGKTDMMQFCHKECDANNWRFYLSWLVLKEHRACQPPPQVCETVDVNNDDEEEDDAVVAGDNSNSNATSTESDAPPSDTGLETPLQSRELFNGPTPAAASIGRHSGGGPGRAGTKNGAAVDAHRKRKQEQTDEMLDTQKDRRVDFNQFSLNQSRVQAFNMARDGLSHCTAIGDEVKIAECRAKMEDTVSFNADADPTPPPDLTGNDPGAGV